MSHALAPVLLLAFATGLLLAPAKAAPPPNILIIVADDMGFSDAGCYGGEIQTPNLDGLAARGLRFTQFYNTGRCWPSRAALLTGYYAQQVRRDRTNGYPLPASHGLAGNGGVRPRWAQLLPAYLKSLGYLSYVAGKWHVDGSPLAGGFDHAYLTATGRGYFGNAGHQADDVPLPATQADDAIYSTVNIADRAIQHLQDHATRHPAQPFFQYIAFHSPHFPLQAMPADIALYRERYQAGWDVIREQRFARQQQLGMAIGTLSPLEPEMVPPGNLSADDLRKRIGPGEVGQAVPWTTLTPEQKKFQADKMAVHAAMVHRMDLEIGRVLAQIKAMGALDNTIVFFVSDNGASAEQLIRGGGHDPAAPLGSAATYLSIGPGWSSAANTPFRLHKIWNHEGGISTPLIVSWPAGIKARGELRTDSAHLIDVAPTILELTGAQRPAQVAGLPVPPLPGLSLVPSFSRDGQVKHDFLWWNHADSRALRIGDWKLVANQQRSWELYDLSQDRSETKNLAATFPDKVKAMEKIWTTRAAEFHTLALQDPPPPAAGKKQKNNTAD